MSNLYRTCVVVVYVAMLCLIAGCAGGYSITTVNGKQSVYKRGEDGKRNLVYTVDADGTTTAYDENDPMYKRHKQKVAFKDSIKNENEQRSAAVKNAPKRAANDPIYVFLATTTTGGKLKKAERSPGATHAQLKKSMAGDPIVQLEDDRAKADVIITPRAFVKDRTGVDKKTGKVVTYPVLTLESKWENVYTGETGTTTDEDHILRNPQLIKRYAETLKRVIKKDIGRMIPADRKKYRPVSLAPKKVIHVKKIYKKK